MNIITKNIPNIFTISNLLLGLISIFYVFTNDLKTASLLIFIGMFLDFFDGFFARILSATSELGKQLDSMADLITFGVAPGFIMLQLLEFHNINYCSINICFVAFLFPIFGAIRLAKFNLDTQQKHNFIGLPIPAAGIFISSLAFIEEGDLFCIMIEYEMLLFISIVLSILLVSKIKLFSLKLNKDEKLNSNVNIFRIILLFSSIILFLFFTFASIPIIIIFYIILSTINNIFK